MKARVGYALHGSPDAVGRLNWMPRRRIGLGQGVALGDFDGLHGAMSKILAEAFKNHWHRLLHLKRVPGQSLDHQCASLRICTARPADFFGLAKTGHFGAHNLWPMGQNLRLGKTMFGESRSGQGLEVLVQGVHV